MFKNPENNYAAKLIDDMGLKGFKIGGAEISTMHSNFIINTSSASSKVTVWCLIIMCLKRKSFERF